MSDCDEGDRLARCRCGNTFVEPVDKEPWLCDLCLKMERLKKAPLKSKLYSIDPEEFRKWKEGPKCIGKCKWVNGECKGCGRKQK